MGCGVLEKEEEVFGRKMNKEMENDYLLPEGLAKRCDLSKFYKISEKIIGEGASGQVCIGEKANQKYAIKRIRKDKIKMPNQIILEVKISLNIKHRNIMNYIEIYEDLKFINCACKITEKNKAQNIEEVGSKREEMKRLLKKLRETNEDVDMNIYNSTKKVNLDTIISYMKDGEEVSFLDNY